MAYFEEPTQRYPLSPVICSLIGYDRGFPVFRKTQRVDQFLEECRYRREYHPRNGYNLRRDFQHVAMVPKEVVAILMLRFGTDYGQWAQSPEFIRWLNSEEARPWRTSNGTV